VGSCGGGGGGTNSVLGECFVLDWIGFCGGCKLYNLCPKAHAGSVELQFGSVALFGG
jgi:hypothetical protein